MLPLAALRRARHPTFRREHLGRSVLCLLERRQLVRPACLVFPPTRDLPVLGRRTAKCLLGGEILHADSYAGLATAGASKSKRRFCTTRGLSYTERRPSGNSSRKRSVSKKKPRGIDEKDTRSNSGIRDTRTGRRSKRMQNLSNLRPTGFGTKPQMGKCTTTTKERITRCCRHGSKSVSELFPAAVYQAWSLPPGAISREPAKGPDVLYTCIRILVQYYAITCTLLYFFYCVRKYTVEHREACQVAAGQQGRGACQQPSPSLCCCQAHSKRRRKGEGLSEP